MEKKTVENQLSGLKDYAEKRSQEIVLKVNDVIDKLVQEGEKITFDAVAKAAGVARGTLYNYPQLKERIRKLKAAEDAGVPTEELPARKTKVQALEDRVAALSDKVAQLEEDKRKLIVQLVDLEELREENERLKRQLRKNIS